MRMSKLSYLPKLSFSELIFLITSSVLTTILGLVLPFAILIIFDRVIPNQSASTLYYLFAIILFAIILDYKVKNIEESLVSNVGNVFERKLTNQLFKAVCDANPTRFKHLEVGEYLERINTIPNLKSYFSGDLVSSFINIFTCAVTIVILSIININTGIIIGGASLLLFVFSFVAINKKVSLLSTKSTIEGITNSKIIEIVTYPLDIKSRSMEYRVENLMSNMINIREYYNTVFEKQESDYSLVLSLVQQLTLTLVVVNGAISVISTDMSQGVMAAVILLTNRYFGPYQQAMKTMGQWKVNKIYIDRLNDILLMQNTHDVKPLLAQVTNSNPAKTSVEPTTQTCVLPDLIFRGRDINFTKGKITLLKGKSGSGKTELLERIQQQFYRDYGTDKPMVKVDKNSSFIDGSIIDNITCFKPQLHKAAYSLCEALSIKEDIDQLKQGFYTELNGNDANVFSRQVSFLLLVVRALLNNKFVIVIDDFDLVYDERVARALLACLRPRTGAYSFIIVSNKIVNVDSMIETITLD
ncbi:ABC transporter transmembrane domain-containing protein [Shewanella youngdeokensis]|uniref:ABC transporter transmembrane domain-containing protein n=1 Tax=Shewanella youngdeokensis TaxID=2999068 RepID=A0ABZ0K4A8_9GAMM|nr:ABC transporter transmembrane domain-containing protein [Shewanella sp. DAU334]